MTTTQTSRRTAGANPALARAEAERRRSNAAGKHADRRTRRRRSRSDARRAAIHEQA